MPEARNKHVVEISIFDGGLNTKADELMVAANQSPSLRNVIFDDYGAIKNRNGWNTHNSTSMRASGQHAVNKLFSYRPSTMSAQLMALCGGTLFVKTGANTAFNTVHSSQDIGVTNEPQDMVQFQDILFLSDRNDPYKFNGNEFTRWGISATSQPLSCNCDAAGGNLNGTYVYTYWGVNSYSAEGDYGAFGGLSVTSGTVRVSNIPTAPVSHGINTWKIGRTTAGAAGVYWYVTDVANGTTSFTDNLADSSLVTLAPTDQGYPRKFSILLVYANRIWGVVAGESLLWYSSINEPEEFPSTNFIRVGYGDGLQISSIASFSGSIVISKADFKGRTAVYNLFIGDSAEVSDPEGWYLKLVSNFGGSEAHHATTAYSNYLMMYNRDGAFAYNGVGISPVGADSARGAFLADAISENISPDLLPSTTASQAVTRDAASIVWKNKVWLSIDTFGEDLNSGEHNAIYQFDYARISNSDRKGGAWTRFDVSDNTKPNLKSFAVHENRLYGGGSEKYAANSGYVYELDTAALETAGHTAQYMTAHLHGKAEHESYHKDFRFAFITAKGSGTLTVGWAADGNKSSTLTTESVTLISSVTRHKVNLGRVSGKRIFFDFRSTLTGSQNFTVSKLELVYTLRGLRNG